MSEPEDTQFSLAEAMQVLQRTPATVRSLLGGLSPEWLNYQEQPEAWSPHAVLIHFIHNERTNWIPRAQVILSEEGDRTFPPFQQMPDEAATDRSLAELLDEFAELRAQRLAELRALDLGEVDFARQGVHPALGTVNLRQLLATWVVHDLNHLHQIAKTLAKRYGQAVGPWRKYLGILDL